MPPRKYHYASNLAADWVLSTPDEDAPNTNREGSSGSGFSKPLSNVAAKPRRYKNLLPQEWIDSGGNIGKSDAPVLRPLTVKGSNISRKERRKSVTQKTDVIGVSTPKYGNSGYTAGNGQGDRYAMSLHYTAEQSDGQAIPTRTRAADISPRATQPPFQARGIAWEQPFHGHDSISPPMSVGQLSSAPTTSSSYGRDLPVHCPKISPSYSVL